MTTRLATWTVALGTVLLGTAFGFAAEPDSLKADEKLLSDARLNADGPALLEFFRARTLKEADRNRIQALIAKLGDDDFQVREQATTSLVTLGKGTAPLLRQAAQTSEDIEIVRRCERCLEVIDKESKVGLVGAAARVMAARKPEKAAEVLLDFLPNAEDERSADEVRGALATLAVVGGKTDQALTDALDDKVALRRGAAVQALIRASKGDQRQKLAKYLQDADALVRFQAAEAFFDAHEKQSVPVLIALLTEVPVERGYEIEELLYGLTAEDAPTAAISKTEGAAKKAQKAWQGWWAQNGEKIDLSKIDAAARMLGYTLIVEWNQNITQGKVKELDRDGKVRWSIDNLSRPVDAVVIPGERVAIAEYTARRVVVRNFKGEEVWQKALGSYPTGLQRLSNGNLLAVCRNQVLELDRDGKDVGTPYTRAAQDIFSAHKARDGKLVVVTRNGTCIRVDTDGKEEKSFQIGNGGIVGVTVYGGIDLLPSGRLLVPMGQQNKVVEVDDQGKILWEAACNLPHAVVKLPNGHVIATSFNGNKAVELDREGKEVTSFTGEGRYLLRVRKR